MLSQAQETQGGGEMPPLPAKQAFINRGPGENIKLRRNGSAISSGKVDTDRFPQLYANTMKRL